MKKPLFLKLLIGLTLFSFLTGLKIIPYPDTCTFNKEKTFSYLHPLGIREPGRSYGFCGMAVTLDIFVGHFLITDATIFLWLIYMLSHPTKKNKIILSIGLILALGIFYFFPYLQKTGFSILIPYNLKYSYGKCHSDSDCKYLPPNCIAATDEIDDSQDQYYPLILKDHPFTKNYTCGCLKILGKCGWKRF